MDGNNKEKTVVVTTSRDILSKTLVASMQQSLPSQLQQQQQPLLLTASVASSSVASSSSSTAASTASSSAAQQYLQQSSSDILRQSFALKPNMPQPSSSVVASSSSGPRPIAPAPPGVLKAVPHSVSGAVAANVASIIRAPTAGPSSPVVGYSGLVGVAGTAGLPKSVMMTPTTNIAHSLTAPGAAILRGYPLPPSSVPAASRLPLAASAADPAARFQVTIVPSRASPTSAGAPMQGVSGILLQPRTPSVSVGHQLPVPHVAAMSTSSPTASKTATVSIIC